MPEARTQQRRYNDVVYLKQDETQQPALKGGEDLLLLLQCMVEAEGKDSG